jgi:hypothetical protein
MQSKVTSNRRNSHDTSYACRMAPRSMVRALDAAKPRIANAAAVGQVATGGKTVMTLINGAFLAVGMMIGFVLVFVAVFVMVVWDEKRKR